MNHLQETTGHLQAVLDQNGSLLSRLGSDVAHATDILASSLSDLTGGTAKFGQEISMQTSRIDQMTATLQGEAISLSQRLDNQVRMLAQSTVELNSEASEFSSVIDRIENRISSLFRSAVVELSGMHDQIETTLGLRSSSVSDAIVASASRVSEALDRLKGIGHRRASRIGRRPRQAGHGRRHGRLGGAAGQRRSHQGGARGLRPRVHRDLRPVGQVPARAGRAVVDRHGKLAGGADRQPRDPHRRPLQRPPGEIRRAHRSRWCRSWKAPRARSPRSSTTPRTATPI